MENGKNRRDDMMTGFAKVMLRTGLAALALGMASSAQAAVLYNVVDLGTLGGTNSFIEGYSSINNAGQVTGFSGTAGDAQAHAFRFSGGVMSDLGSPSSQSSGVGINNSGQVVGYFEPNSSTQRAFLYSGGVMSDLGTLGGKSAYAAAINDAGQVTGSSLTTGNSLRRAFIYSGGVMSNLGSLGGFISQGNGINASGQVAGTSFISGNVLQRAFLYSGGVMNNLGTLGGVNSSSFGNAVNNAGQVSGYSQTAAGERAFLYSGGVMNNLGTLGGTLSRGHGINAAGHVVGYSTTTGNAAVHAFFYSGGVMSDLQTLIDPATGWLIREAYDINDSGQIVGHGVVGGRVHAFLLNPIITSPGVPEPANWALMITGFGLVGGALRSGNGRRRHRVRVTYA
jgi:probable HAF family extracellular repeat protein